MNEIIRLRDANMFSRMCACTYIICMYVRQAPARLREDDGVEEKAASRFIITGSAALLQWRRYLN